MAFKILFENPVFDGRDGICGTSFTLSANTYETFACAAAIGQAWTRDEGGFEVVDAVTGKTAWNPAVPFRLPVIPGPCASDCIPF